MTRMGVLRVMLWVMGGVMEGLAIDVVSAAVGRVFLALLSLDLGGVEAAVGEGMVVLEVGPVIALLGGLMIVILPGRWLLGVTRVRTAGSVPCVVCWAVDEG